MMEGLRTAAELVVIIVILLAYGCPVQAIVHAYGVDERTVADWQKRAGNHCQQVHHALVEQGKVNTHQAEAKELQECAAPCIESMNSSSWCLYFFRLYHGQR